MEDLQDLAAIVERRDETTISHEELNHTFGVPFYCTITWGRGP